MFYLFFQDWLELSFPKAGCSYSDFMLSCNQPTREIIVGHTYSWLRYTDEYISNLLVKDI